VGWLLAFENAAGVNAELALPIDNARPVAHQSASFDKLALIIHGGHRVASGKRDELNATRAEQYLRSHQQRIRPLLRKARKDSVDVEIGCGAEDVDLPPDRRRCRLHLCDRGLPEPNAGSDKQRKALGSWQELVQEPKPLAHNAHCQISDTCRIAPRLVEASDQARFDRVHAGAEDNWNGRGQAFEYACRISAGGSGDDRDATSDQISGPFRQPIVLIVGPAIFDRYVLALDKARIFQALAE